MTTTEIRTRKGDRLYVHHLPPDWDKNGPRSDFTQTILFESALLLADSESLSDKLNVMSEFFLNDQVTSFMIRVNAYSSQGKYGYAQKLLNSTKLIYSEFMIPPTLVLGDFLSIPVTIYNNFNQAIVVSVIFNETRDGEPFKSVT